jgi:hypothetical protein
MDFASQNDGLLHGPVRRHRGVSKTPLPGCHQGEVRARLKGLVLGPEWLKQIAAMTYDDNPFTLPPNLELSVEDAKRLFSPLNPRLRIVVRATAVLIFVHNFGSQE